VQGVEACGFREWREERGRWSVKTKQDHLRLIMADYSSEELEAAQDWISRYQDELAEAREELERAKAAQPAEIGITEARVAVRAALERSRKLGLWADEPRLQRALDALDAPAETTRTTQPATESGPVVGGVTETMLDDLVCELRRYPKARSAAIDRARAAIRATKRVDVEALRKVASELGGSGDPQWEDAIHRAIGDEPAVEAPSPEPAAPAQEFTRMGCFFRRNGADWLRIVDGSRAHRADEMLRLLNAGLEAESRALTAAARARDAIVKRLESAGIEYSKSGSPDEAAEAVIAQAVAHVKRVAELESIAEDQESKLADLDRTCAHQKSRIESAERLVADLRSQLRTFAWVPPMPERMIPLDQETLKWSVLAGHCADLRAGIAIPDRESEEWREGLAAARERIAKAEAEELASRAGDES
jgi:hypothetical protein